MRRSLALLVMLAVVAVATFATAAWPAWRQRQALEQLLTTTTPAAGAQTVACSALRKDPIVLLVLGQSNAANHGESAPGGAAVQLVSPQGCLVAVDPLPGATGREASIWTRLPAALQSRGVTRPLVLGLVALDGVAAQPWVESNSPLRRRLLLVVEAMQRQGLPPQFVLWQQGEADARRGTPAAQWEATLRELAGILSASGVQAPILIARSTVCNSAADSSLHGAIARLIASSAQFRAGADTDKLVAAPLRRSGNCHFSAIGLRAAAELWADRLVEELAAVPATSSTFLHSGN